MGEAKRRTLAGILSGQNPRSKRAESPFHRGLVLRPPYQSIGGGIQFSPPDAHEMRLGILYWDKIASPQNNIIDVAPPEFEMLEAEGVLLRPKFSLNYISMANVHPLIEAHLATFDQLEKSAPGRWALSQGNRQELLNGNAVAANTGFLVDLVKALPIPMSDTPIEKILNFKAKRRPELLRLRGAIEGMQEKVLKAENRDEALNRYAQEIELACLDLIAVSREEWKIFNLADLQTLFGGGSVAAAAEATFHAQMPTVAGILGITGTGLKIARDVGLRRQQNRQNPYWYIAKFHSQILS